jgi:hypothetical protein
MDPAETVSPPSQMSFRNVALFSVFRILDDGQSPKNPYANLKNKINTEKYYLLGCNAL